ncbi:MAG: xanthine dehydrogenase family protein molybdopterin-binding subunit, partial [Alphaproteobacteria bacterium]|nr:xanthine dehydrogenase family protein molybdopterin-binding subunit [Alphaproteobacteria bacterium]
MVKPTDPHADTLERELDTPDAEGYRAIGQPIRRKEDYRMLTGAGRFSDDFRSPGEAYAAIVRSPYPHARIKDVDGTAALAMPGVRLVLTGADCLADGLKPIPHSPVPSTRFDMKLTGPGGTKVFEGPHMLLPADKVRHVGEAVAMVVAESREQALDGAEAVEVDYEELPSVHRTADALKPGAPLVWDEAQGNILVDTTFGDKDATDRAFAEADHVIARDFDIGRVTGVPLEPRAALGVFDADTGRYTLYAGSGGAVRQKGEMSTVLGVDREDLRVLSYDVGGNFGTRNRIYVEFGLVLWASGKLKRPVKYTATRSESFLSDYQGRDLVTKVELAMKADGRFLGLRATNISNAGARCVSLSPLAKGSALITGSYDIPAATLRAMSVFTNTAPTQAYRSSGRPEVNFALERLIDIACRELGFDRIELRRKNFIAADAMPYRNALDTRYDSGTYEDNMDLVMGNADWGGFEERSKEAAGRGRLLGLGLSHYVESSTGAPRERTEILVKPEGAVDVVIGTQPSGQGHETSFAQVVSDLLGVPVAAINIIMGDTDLVSLGGGSHSGRSMRHAATVMSIAATELIGKACRIAAIVFGLEADQVAFTDGRFRAADSNRSLDFLELARDAAGVQLPDDLADGLFMVTDNEMHEQVFPNGCAVCEIEVDPETG